MNLSVHFVHSITKVVIYISDTVSLEKLPILTNDSMNFIYYIYMSSEEQHTYGSVQLIHILNERFAFIYS